MDNIAAAIYLVDRLLNLFPPDTEKIVDGIRVQNSNLGTVKTMTVYQPAYTLGRLEEMLEDRELVTALHVANQDTPLWRGNVRNFLIARFS